MSVQDAYNKVFSNFQKMRDYLAPVLKNSKFKETGCITPEEFVAAGDFLVYKCPTWSWEGGLEEKTKDYLPADKQFLVTRNVPCLHRARQMEYTEDDSETQVADDHDEEDWMYTHSNRATKTMEEIAQTIMTEEEEEAEIKRGLEKLELDKIPDLDDIPNMDDIPDMDDQVEEEDDPAVDHSKSKNDKVLQVRTYDVFITYDKYYQTPRMWLFGYDEERRPLTSTQVFEDVSQDYVKKTVTIETHPHLSLNLASIHPCKHAEVMKKIIERMSSKDEENGIRVDQYMIIFLKFLSSVVPTIDYDHTIST
ncbi:Putative Autophagy-related protein 3 [Rhizopus microsporus]|nr:Putative Autophagy-related protein 3 [Rhizopus microsporus]